MAGESIIYVDRFRLNANAHHWASGLIKAGWSVGCIDTSSMGADQILQTCSLLRPEAILFGPGSLASDAMPMVCDLVPDAFRFLFYGDIEDRANERVADLADEIDCLLISNSDESMFQYFSDWGHTVFEFQCATEPRMYHPVKGIKATKDAVFVGSRVPDVRSDDYVFRNIMVQRLYESGILRVYGGGWSFGEGFVKPEFFSRAICGSKIHLVINGFGYLSNCFSNRTWNALASGRMVLHYRVKDSEKYFEDGKHLKFFRSKKELIELIRFYVKKNAARERIARAGVELVTKEHTYKNRGHRLREIYEEVR